VFVAAQHYSWRSIHPLPCPPAWPRERDTWRERKIQRKSERERERERGESDREERERVAFTRCETKNGMVKRKAICSVL
jgi:hypothetical protein